MTAPRAIAEAIADERSMLDLDEVYGLEEGVFALLERSR